MKGLSFFSRFAFICNLLFVVCLFMQRTGLSLGRQELNGTVIVLGWFMAPVLNLGLNIWYGYLLLEKKKLPSPAWLSYANFLLLLLQLFYHFILPS